MGRLEDMEQGLQFIQQMAGFQFGNRHLKDKEKNENPGEKKECFDKNVH